jgi:O-antigen ligase
LYLYLVNETFALEAVFLPVAAQLLIQAVVGIAQFLRQSSLGLDAIGELVLDPAWHGVSVVVSGGSRLLRAYGLADHPNILAGCLAFGILVLLIWYLRANPRWRPPLVGVFVLSGIALLLTFSRAAWLALISASALFILFLYRNNQIAALRKLLLLIVTGVMVSVPFIWQNARYIGVRLNWDESFSQVPQEIQALGERQLLNRAANEIFVENALTGVGLGASPHALLEKYPQLPVYYQPAHFTLLDAAVETGLFGALFYALMIIAPWLLIWLNRKRMDFSPEFIGVSSLLLAVTVVGFFDYYTWLLVPGRLWQWLTWGLWGGVYQSSLQSSLLGRSTEGSTRLYV